MKEYQRIADIAWEYNADDGFAYSSPARGVWNIVHMGTLVPEGHQIFVCPTSCLRGVVLTTAEMGAMDKLSTITVGEDNILEGDMEETLHEGTRKVIESLPVRPRMMMIFTSCIHHFLAVNYQRIYRLLREEYPDIDFVDCYMHPIMRRTSPPVPTLWRQMYRVLKPAEKNPKQVNVIACDFPRGPYCDAVTHLKKQGIMVTDVTGSRTYDEFLTMAHASRNILFHKAGMMAAKDLKIRLEQPFRLMRPVCDYDIIDADMAALSEECGIPAPTAEEISELRKQTEEAVRRAKEVLAGRPVAVDGTAVDNPLGLSLWLLQHGIRVVSLFVDSFTEDESIFRTLQENWPDLRVYNAISWNMRRMERGYREESLVAIGQRAAYFHDTNYFVNLVDYDGMYGYRGLIRLMELLTEAAQEEKDMRSLIQIKGWGCSCG